MEDRGWKVADILSSIFDPLFSISFHCDALRRRRLLTPARDPKFTIDDHCRNPRQIAFGKRIERIVRNGTGDLVQQDEIRRPSLFYYTEIQIMGTADIAGRHANGLFGR